ncbi:hypothetical protein BVG19_g1476 [[Candida] boidinii]|nr:hypothetical protein BVG19_g1476 [[Candida] boidinii]OWB51053.1 hypothetical protein B5S27_g2610 [[Candida] boidinii]
MAFPIKAVVTALQVIPLAFLIIATVTAPATNKLYLSSYNDVKYGVLGFCSSDSCTTAVGNDYQPSVIDSSSDSNWKFKPDARNKLALILLACPISAGLTFVTMLLNLINNFIKQKVVYILAIVLSVFAFLGSALTCIAVILLFYPNISWPAWLLIPAAVLNLVVLILTCLSYRLSGEDDDEDDYEDDKKDIGNTTDSDDNLYFKPNGENVSFQLNNNKLGRDNSFIGHMPPPILGFNNNNHDQNSLNSSSFMEEKQSVTDVTVPYSKASYNFSNNNTSGSLIGGGSVLGTTSNANSGNVPKIPMISNPYEKSDALLELSNSANVNADNGNNNKTNLSDVDNESLTSLNNNNSTINNRNSDLPSDSDSEFTSVSQRAINPQYYDKSTQQQQQQPLQPVQQIQQQKPQQNNYLNPNQVYGRSRNYPQQQQQPFQQRKYSPQNYPQQPNYPPQQNYQTQNQQYQQRGYPPQQKPQGYPAQVAMNMNPSTSASSAYSSPIPSPTYPPNGNQTLPNSGSYYPSNVLQQQQKQFQSPVPSQPLYNPQQRPQQQYQNPVRPRYNNNNGSHSSLLLNTNPDFSMGRTNGPRKYGNSAIIHNQMNNTSTVPQFISNSNPYAGGGVNQQLNQQPVNNANQLRHNNSIYRMR